MSRGIIEERKEGLNILFSIITGILLSLSVGWFSIYSGSINILIIFLGFLSLAVSFYKPLWGLLILIGFFLSPQLFQSLEITPLEIFWGILFGIIFLGALSKVLLGRGKIILSFKKEGLLWANFFFILWSSVSLLVTLKEGGSFIWWLREYVDFIGYFLIFWIVWSIGKGKEKWIKVILISFFLVGTIKGFQQLIYYSKHLPEAITENNFQILRRGFYAQFFGFPCSIIAMCFYAYSKTQREKIIFGITTFFFLLILILSFTRSIWLGFGVSFLVLVIKFKLFRVKMAKILLVSCIFAGIVLFLGFCLKREVTIYLFKWVDARFFSFFRLEFDLSFLDRLAEWKALWKLIWKKPLIGHGIGSSFVFYSVNPWSWAREGGIGWVNIRFSHNLYLYLLYTMGIFGLIFFAGIIINVFKEARKIWSESEDSFTKAYCVAIYSICIGFLVTSITCPIFMGKTNSVYIGLLIGMLAILNRKSILKKNKT